MVYNTMKFEKIVNYVESSFGDKPSFVLLMSNGREYISNGCVFVENTEDNIDELNKIFECKEFIDELLDAPGCSIYDIADARYMFRGCGSITEFNEDMPNTIAATGMFIDCYSLQRINSSMPNVMDVNNMCTRCRSLYEFNGAVPKAVYARDMFEGCDELIEQELSEEPVGFSL